MMGLCNFHVRKHAEILSHSITTEISRQRSELGFSVSFKWQIFVQQEGFFSPIAAISAPQHSRPIDKVVHCF
jgi:hypothetical protein